MNQQQTQALWADLIIEELARCGVRHLVICPGSRSTPLTAAAARLRLQKLTVCHDERAAGFLALGIARSSEMPAAVITTSGTAVANLLPAVIEASQDRVGMILLTADRPPELRDACANQTIIQPGIFSSYTRWAVDLPCPDPHIDPVYVLTSIDQAVFRSTQHDPGPVHINCMLREPLVPPKKPFSIPSDLGSWRDSPGPWTLYLGAPDVSAAAFEGAAELFSEIKDGLILIGRSPHLRDEYDEEALKSFFQRTGFPVWADVNSGLRLEEKAWGHVPFFDYLFQSPDIRNRLINTVILHLGGPMISTQLARFLVEEHDAPYLVVNSHPDRQDPVHCVSARIQADPVIFAGYLANKIPQKPESPLLQDLCVMSRGIDSLLRETLLTLSEPAIARAISELIPKEQILFSGNSMPVRDLELFSTTRPAAPAILGNRGASGIDGNIATALGIALGAEKTTTALIGDLAFMHDIGSLALCAAHIPYMKNRHYGLVIVVINNHGGGIFSFLPISERPEVFSPFFDTPHQWDFKHAAEQFGLQYAAPKTMTEFAQAYEKAVRKRDVTIIEVETDREENYQLHMNLNEAIQELIESSFNWI